MINLPCYSTREGGEWWAESSSGRATSNATTVSALGGLYGWWGKIFFRPRKNSDNCDKEILLLARCLRPPVSGTNYDPLGPDRTV